MSRKGDNSRNDRCAACGHVRADHGNHWASKEVRDATAGYEFQEEPS